MERNGQGVDWVKCHVLVEEMEMVYYEASGTLIKTTLPINAKLDQIKRIIMSACWIRH